MPERLKILNPDSKFAFDRSDVFGLSHLQLPGPWTNRFDHLAFLLRRCCDRIIQFGVV